MIKSSLNWSMTIWGINKRMRKYLKILYNLKNSSSNNKKRRLSFRAWLQHVSVGDRVNKLTNLLISLSWIYPWVIVHKEHKQPSSRNSNLSSCNQGQVLLSRRLTSKAVTLIAASSHLSSHSEEQVMAIMPLRNLKAFCLRKMSQRISVWLLWTKNLLSLDAPLKK